MSGHRPLSIKDQTIRPPMSFAYRIVVPHIPRCCIKVNIFVGK